MEQHIVFVVQFWVKGYGYWADVIERPEGMFDIPQVGYDTEDQGRERVRALCNASPAATYRLIRRTTTEEEI